MGVVGVKMTAIQTTVPGSAMKNKPCTYPWRAMWGDQLPPECEIRVGNANTAFTGVRGI